MGLAGAGGGALERQPDTGAVVDEEEQAGVRRNRNLGVVTGGLEGAIAAQQGGVELAGALQGGAQDGSAQAMEVAAGGVEDEQPLRGKRLAVEMGKGLAKVRPGW